MADRFKGILPHEIFMGERDMPGKEIPTWLLFFDIQALEMILRREAKAAN